MRSLAKTFSLILALCLIFCAGCASAEAPVTETTPAPTPETPEASSPVKADIPQDNLGYSIGLTLPDFEFTDYNGTRHSLYASLAEKDLVLINIWATWCGPCGMEFPYMEEAYQLYSDEVAIFALSCEPSDDNDKLAEYAAEMGMSFPVGRDEAELAVAFMAYSIPTTIVVDRFGTVCAVEVGAKTSTADFTELFDRYLGEEYTGYTDPNALPVCDVAPASEAELTAALGGDGDSLTFGNADSEYIWPMLPDKRDSRDVLCSSNTGIAGTSSALTCRVTADEGDALAIDFALSSEAGLDLMKIYVDGTLVKCFGGEYGWTRYAYAFESAGEHAVVISYEKNSYGDLGSDCLWLDSIELVGGEEAAAALKANPAYTYGDTTLLIPTTASAREIVFDDPQSVLAAPEDAGNMSFFIVPEEKVDFLLTLAPGTDPEALLFFSDYDGSFSAVSESMSEIGYHFTSGLDSMETSGYPYSMLYLEDVTGFSGLHKIVVCFHDEENVNAFVKTYLSDAGGNALVSWKYADGSLPATGDLAGESTDAEYTVRYIDQSGSAVPGVTLQVCDDSICQIYVSDENGECRFTLPAYPYELHTLIVPEGYEGDTESLSLAPENGGIIEFTLMKK